MRTLAIRRQVRLGFARVAEICLHGICHRLFRSLVTLSIVTVAVAFLMYMLAGSLVGRAVLRQAQTEAAACKLYDRWVAWFEEPMDAAALFRVAAEAPDDDPRLRGLAAWSGLDGPGFAGLRDVARDGQRLVQSVEALSPGRRLLLAGDLGGAFLLDALSDPSACDRFLRRAADLGGVRLPGGAAGVRALLARYRTQRPAWQRLADGRQAAIRQLHAAFPAAAGALLAAPPPTFAATLAGLNLLDDAAVLRRIEAEARDQADLARLAECLRNTIVRRDVAARAGVNNLRVTFAYFARVYLGRGGPAFFEASLRKGGVAALPFDRAHIRALLTDYLRRLRVLRIEADAAGYREGWLGFSPTALWLIGVSFVVCVVGVANAMLMSVMERFREIATMKCLGARDGFVKVLFVLESCVQGVAGGVLGALLGLLLAVPAGCVRFGALAWSTLPWAAVGLATLLAVAIGVALAGVASLYPAHVAARLAPMEAMRVE